MTSAHQFACQLKNRGIIRLGGDDRRSFLQGLISNDINSSKPGAPIYAALLTPQGKFLHDMFIVDTGSDFLIDCEMERAEDLIKRLTTYKLRAKVTLQNTMNEFDVWAIWPLSSFRGARSASPESHLVSSTQEKLNGMPAFAGMTSVYVDPRMSELGLRLTVRKNHPPLAGGSTGEAGWGGVKETDFSTYDEHRIKLAVPDGSRDMIPEKSTLLECNIDRLNGISWSKGCYVGQELTARMHHRALLKKRLYTVTIEDPAPAFGTPIYIDSEDIGDMRSHCANIGLALLNIEKAEAAMKDKTALVCGGARLRTTTLPLREGRNL